MPSSTRSVRSGSITSKRCRSVPSACGRPSRPRRPVAEGERTMYPAAFEYHAPASVADALKLLGKLDDAKILAGGHSLIPMMNLRLAPPKHLIDPRKVSGLTGIKESGGTISLGAMSTHWEVESSKALKGNCAIVSE